MKLSDRIHRRLREWEGANSNDIIIQNFYVGFYEADMLRVTGSDFIIEYEIKISRSDFKNDFKKGSKHFLMANKKGHSNRFYFVVPENLIHINEVPDHAGLIYFYAYEKSHGSFRVVKNAPLIHKTKITQDFYKQIARKLSFRERNMRSDLEFFKEKRALASREVHAIRTEGFI